MLAVTEPGVHVITVMTCTQLLKTALLESVFGYFAHLDPCPMLLVQPKEEAAEQFGKERISPMVKATPVLRDLVGTSKTRQAEETLLFKAFPGGFLALVGAGSPDNLARRPVRVTLFDEVDKYPVTREGDPIALGEERTATFGLNWLSVRACSPTVEDESRIALSYADGDQRRASVVCPHCSHRFFPDFFKHVNWDKGSEGEHLTHSARIYCEACGVGWSEGDRLRALPSIRWHQTRGFTCCGKRQSPLDDYANAWRDGAERAVDAVWDWWESPRHAVYRARCHDCGGWPVDNAHASFTASKLFSPWQKDKPADIAGKWIAAKDNEDLKQVFWNTQLGLPYRRRAGREIEGDVLLSRREIYPAEVPDGVAALTFGADLQDNRAEIEVVGWGRDEESWSVDYHVIEGDPQQPEFWARVDAYLLRKWKRADGREFTLEAGCFDSGGHHTQKVYEFCKARVGRRIFAIKGASEQSGQRSPVWPNVPKRHRTKSGFKPVIVGTNAAKDSINARLQIEIPGPGYCHFPVDRDANYFAQLTAERLVAKKVAGRHYRVWQLRSGRTNEALDCRVYAYAALCAMLQRGFKLNRRADEIGARPREIVLAGTPEGDRISSARPAPRAAGAMPEALEQFRPGGPAGADSSKPRMARPRVVHSAFMQRLKRGR
jgi:phage terminase large subunit GpA-like protein